MHVELVLEADAGQNKKLNQMQCQRDKAGERCVEGVTYCGYNAWSDATLMSPPGSRAIESVFARSVAPAAQM